MQSREADKGEGADCFIFVRQFLNPLCAITDKEGFLVKNKPVNRGD